MQTLTRRTALAAVPALAAIPAMAATTNPDPLAVSPRIAALDKERRDSGEAINERIGPETNRLSAIIKARGVVHPGTWDDHLRRHGSPKTFKVIDGDLMEATGDPLNPWRKPRTIPSYEKALDAHRAAYAAQPEAAEIERLEEAAGDLCRRSWDCLDELLAIPAVTFGDLATQVGALIDHTEDSILEGDQRAFLRSVPSEIRRLAGAS